MKCRRLGKSPLFVSEIGLGTMIFGTQCDVETSLTILDKSFDIGINFYDSAEIYPVPSTAKDFGLSESILGDWIKTMDRSAVIVSTKVSGSAQTWYKSPARSGMAALDRVQIRKALEGSLKRLNTDYIDVYQAHWPDHGARLEDLLDLFHSFIKEGKIRVIGCSNETSWGLMKALWISEANRYTRFDVIQNSYSFHNRRFEDELAEVCLYEDVSLVAYAPLSGGVLTGKYNTSQQSHNFRFNHYSQGEPRQKSIASRYVNHKTLESALRFCEIAQRDKVSPAALALAWNLQHDYLASSLIGISNPQQLDDIAYLENYEISEEALSSLEAISKEIPYPMEYGF
jgi:aryl-alcohol dehydrogenase-like predicted oxidoreductase